MANATHSFSFDGGDILATFGATWFVSYAYYKHIDTTHRNWERVKTSASRASTFDRSTKYHKYWLGQVLKMHDTNLKKNTIGITPAATKKMASELLAKALVDCNGDYSGLEASAVK
jgi:hypothetical protein